MKKIFLSIIFLFVLNYTVKAQVIDGYTDKQSYRAGETVSFFINGTPNDYNCWLCFDVSSNTDFFLFALDGSYTFIGSHPLNFQSSTTSNAWENGFQLQLVLVWSRATSRANEDARGYAFATPNTRNANQTFTKSGRTYPNNN